MRPSLSPLAVAGALGLALAAGVGAGPREDLAAEFLDALIYRDHATLWSLLDDESRGGFTAESFAAALDAAPLAAESASVVATEEESGALRVRFRLEGVHPTSGERLSLPGTLRVVETPLGLRVAFRPPSPGVGTDLVGRASDRVRTTLPALPPSQVIDGMTVEEVIRRAEAVAGQVQTMRMGLTVASSLVGQASTLRGEFLFRAPNQMRLDLGEALFVSDGVQGFLHLPAANTYFRLPLGFGGDLFQLATGLTGAEVGTQASLVGRDDVGGRPAWHLVVAPSAGGTAGDTLGATMPMHLWLDTENYLPRRAQAGLMGTAMDLVVESVEINTGTIADEAFHFAPPPGAMELPLALPALGGS